MRFVIGTVLALGIVAILTGRETTSAQDPCTALKGAKVAASAIGLPTSGAEVRGAEVTGSYCKVTGAIRPVDPTAPDINFQVNLPTAWNNKAVHFGGGGYNGTVVTGLNMPMQPPGAPTAVAQGYVTFGSDSGHANAPGRDIAAFAANAEALANFGGDQLKKTRDTMVAIVSRRYGRPPARTYFVGGSQGGHEAFLAIQRWPADYDGALALYPVYNFAALQTNGVQQGQVLYSSPAAWLSPAKAAMISRKVMAACDRLDGLADGLIANVSGCNRAFRPESLACPGGADAGDQCLSADQLKTLKFLASGHPTRVTLQGGVRSYPRWPVLEGATAVGRMGFGASPAPGKPPTASDAFVYYMGDQMMRHMVMKDAASDSMAFDPKANAAKLRAVSDLIDASDDDLTPFKARGGKLLLLHGTTDMAVSPHNTTAYYDRLRRRFGPRLAEFARYYVVPGYEHNAGDFTVGWDGLLVLDAWADRGQAPGPQVAVDLARATAGRQRPLCEYPLRWHYKGSGDPNSAASFTCVSGR